MTQDFVVESNRSLSQARILGRGGRVDEESTLMLYSRTSFFLIYRKWSRSSPVFQTVICQSCRAFRSEKPDHRLLANNPLAMVANLLARRWMTGRAFPFAPARSLSCISPPSCPSDSTTAACHSEREHPSLQLRWQAVTRRNFVQQGCVRC
jgi:hypothetical protein